MSNIKAQFDKAVQIVKELPAEGPLKPTQDDQLLVSGGTVWRLVWGGVARRRLTRSDGRSRRRAD